MYISTLDLENFRGIKKLPIELDEHINVFVGMNGSGKSTLLDASAVMLSWLINRIKHSGSSGRPITEADIRNGENFSKVDLALKLDSDDVMWSQVKTRRARSHTEKSDFKQLNELAKRMQQDMEEQQGNLSLLAYYPVNRAVLDIPLRIRQRHSFDLLSAFDDSLTSGASFRTFFEWFREREDLENEQRSDNLQPDDTQLNAVREALNQFMPDFTDLRVRRNPLRMEVKKSGEVLTVDQLSDGEKCLMAMVGDLARRLAIANPDRDDPLLGDGIVMIDEVDLHLHPKWQRMMVARLRETFPGIQFLLSTHSPHVLNHVSADNIYLMSSSPEGISVVKPTESYGRNVDRILEDLMGLNTTRPDKIDEELLSVFSAISQGDLEKAGKKIEALAKEIGEDPELVKARVLIKRKELIGK
ncbi:AAA family ATPase [Microbulbifer sp. MKSA007]|nr:AAA family ATPase [Microbulbifer sp. MKSA007]